MKAFIKWLAIIVLTALLLGFFAWSFVPGMVSRELTKKMGVPVTVGSIGLSPWSISVSNLVIANPAGSMMKRALVVKTIDVKAPISRYFQDKIVIDEVDLNNIILGLEFNKPLSRDGNWTTIMNNYQRSSRSQSKKDQKEKPVLIKRLIVRNMDIWIAFRDNPQGGIKRLKGIKYMELKNISSKKGIPIDEITQQVIGEMLLEVFQREGIQNMLQGIFDSATGGGGIFGGFQGLFGLESTANEEVCR